MAWLPIHVQAHGMLCAVFGGGAVAERKIRQLLEAGAKVKVISSELTGAIEEWEAVGEITVCKRQFRPGDTSGAFLVIAATDDDAVNERICCEAKERNILVNHAGKAEAATVIMPAVLRRGRLLLSVSTSGGGPAVTARLLGRLEEQFGERTAAFLDFYAEMRLRAKQIVKDRKQRERLLRAVAELDWPESFDPERLEHLHGQIDRLLEEIEQGTADVEIAIEDLRRLPPLL